MKKPGRPGAEPDLPGGTTRRVRVAVRPQAASGHAGSGSAARRVLVQRADSSLRALFSASPLPDTLSNR